MIFTPEIVRRSSSTVLPKRQAPTPQRIRRNRFLIIGCGDCLRGDDAAAPLVAATVSSWQLESVTSLTVDRLAPKLVFNLASADYTIFVESCSEDSCAQTTQTSPIVADRSTFKTINPDNEPCSCDTLLALTQQFYDRFPQCWVLKIPTERFGLGQPLSSVSRTGVDSALRTINRFLRTYQ